MSITICKTCLSEGEHPIYSIREMMFGSGEYFRYLQCRQCNSIQLVDEPKDIEYYYPDDYYAYSPLILSNFQVNLIKRLRLKAFLQSEVELLKPVYGEWMKFLSAKKNERIADIGCGNGQLLYELFATGFRHLEGFDPFIPASRQVNKKVKLHKKGLEEVDGEYDVIMLHHTFEHLKDPRKAIEKITQLLAPGGRCLLRMPVADAEVWDIYRENWVQLDAPRHFIIPSIKGIQILADAFGLELYKVVFDSTEFQFWGSECYKEGVSFVHEFTSDKFSRDDMKRYKEKAIKLNAEGKGDQACFYLRKPG
ncbi:class I SAM-dependent methyltransferase [Pleomorphovibrio marinus]|uniref:class I SAM-dependent methyltransferase n=1 Tax=Pleomorphovibrio marinus TaxID=2164132 RepID=UPI000E0AD710|nr:class I SAM-dependent methyltransferase [Pleomorphovibrio marinus]